MSHTSVRGVSETTQRQLVVSVRLTQNEKDAITKNSSQHHLSLSAYMRDMALEGHQTKRARKRSVSAQESRQIALILARLAFVMDRIRDEEATPFLDELTLHIMGIRDDCFIALGKRP